MMRSGRIDPKPVVFMILVSCLLIIGGAASSTMAANPGDVVISEIRTDQPSTDNDEYFELYGPADTSLDGLTYLVIGDSTAGGSGVIEAVVDLGGQAIPTSGYFVAAENTFTLGTAVLTTTLNFENSDNVTHLLVSGFSGTLYDDLDVDDNGILDSTPWTEELDRIALILQDNPPTTTEYHYGPPTVGPDGAYVPGHAFRCPEQWEVGAFETGIDDTPGGENDCPLVITDPQINEFVFNHADYDTHEFAEVLGDPETDYSAYTLLQIEGDGTGAGVVDGVLPVGSTDIGGFWVTGFFANEFENGTVTLLLVKDFAGNPSDDLDTDNDGVFDSEPWSALVDAVAVSDGGGTDLTYAATVLAAYFDGMSFTPGGASRLPDGADNWMRNDFDGEGLPGFIGTPVVGEAINTPGATNQAYVPPPGQCGEAFTPIYTIQGSGTASYLDGLVVSTEGVVVGDFQAYGQKGGFFLQDALGDGDPLTSDGIFVYHYSTAVAPGDLVRVYGTVDEYDDLTEITSVSQVLICSTGNSVAPTLFTLPVDDLVDFEPNEGMLVTFTQTLTISEYYNFDRYGEIVLTVGRQYQPTAIYEPGSPEAAQLAQENTLGRITLDDGRTSQNPDPAIHPNGLEFTLDNLFRGGDLVTNVTGALDYAYDLWRIQPTLGAD